jgi:hypothetical protein
MDMDCEGVVLCKLSRGIGLDCYRNRIDKNSETATIILNPHTTNSSTNNSSHDHDPES